MTLNELILEVENAVCYQTADEAAETIDLLLAVVRVRSGGSLRSSTGNPLATNRIRSKHEPLPNRMRV